MTFKTFSAVSSVDHFDFNPDKRYNENNAAKAEIA